MYFYTAYGLGIHSPVRLPELVAVENILKDVDICLRKLDSSERNASPNRKHSLGKAEGIGTFLVRDGNKVIIEPNPGVEEFLLSTTLLGAGMAVLLRQRGLAVLHASGIVINGGAVAFVGQSGWGKSTLAEAFYNRGYGVVTDDVLAVRIEDSCPQAIPAYPSVKLFPNVAAFLGCHPTDAPVCSHTDKRAHSVALRFPQGPLPLRRVYVLDRGERNMIERLRPQETFLELLRNARAVSLLRDSESLNMHLRQSAMLAAKVPTFRLTRRPDLSAIPDLLALVEQDLA